MQLIPAKNLSDCYENKGKKVALRANPKFLRPRFQKQSAITYSTTCQFVI